MGRQHGLLGKSDPDERTAFTNRVFPSNHDGEAGVKPPGARGPRRRIQVARFLVGEVPEFGSFPVFKTEPAQVVGVRCIETECSWPFRSRIIPGV